LRVQCGKQESGGEEEGDGAAGIRRDFGGQRQTRPHFW